MQIYGPYRVSTAATGNVGSASAAGKTNDVNRTAGLGGPKPSAAPVDQLDLSTSTTPVNRLASTEATAGGDIRIDKVANLRREIASGSYDTPEKLDAALDRMLDAWA